MARFAAIAFARIRIELGLAKLEEGDTQVKRGILPPLRSLLAVVVARSGGAVQKETDLLGNTRIDEVSEEARALGVRKGQTIAAARAKLADLLVRVVRVDAVREVLARVAEAGLAFGATTSFDTDKDVVWVDVTGCVHLLGGERSLANKLTERVRAMGHACRVAIADGPRVAAAVARHASSSRGPIVVPPGGNRAAMAPLPLRSLPLDDEALAWLSNVGMRVVGDLQGLPRASLGTRLSAAGERVMQLLDGDDRAPLAPYRPPQVPEERAELEYGIESGDALVFVVKTLCDRLAPRLEGRGVAVAKVELALSPDRALLPPSAKPTMLVSIALPAPLARAGDLLRVLRARLAGDSTPAPILAVTLRAAEVVPAMQRALHLFTPEAKADRALPALASELAAELGEAHVGVLELCDTWVPEERARLVPLSTGVARRGRRLVSSCTEPSRFLGTQGGRAAIEVPPLVLGTLLVRFETVEWWRGAIGTKDVVAAWHPRAQSVAWVEVDREKRRARLRGWLD